ncbi:MAG: hypothetical protein AAGA56_06225 [Myxococcota bacterium]
MFWSFTLVSTLALLACDANRASTERTSPTSSYVLESIDDSIPTAELSASKKRAAPPSDDGNTSTGEATGDEAEIDPDCAKPEEDLKPMQLLRFAFASGLEGKDPKDKLHIARPGQRIYAHLTLRNRSGRKRCATLTFRVGGKKRTEIKVKIGESWSWRTWAYNTLRSDDREPLELTVRDDKGGLVLREKLAVVPAAK